MGVTVAELSQLRGDQGSKCMGQGWGWEDGDKEDSGPWESPADSDPQLCSETREMTAVILRLLSPLLHSWDRKSWLLDSGSQPYMVPESVGACTSPGLKERLCHWLGNSCGTGCYFSAKCNPLSSCTHRYIKHFPVCCCCFTAVWDCNYTESFQCIQCRVFLQPLQGLRLLLYLHLLKTLSYLSRWSESEVSR